MMSFSHLGEGPTHRDFQIWFEHFKQLTSNQSRVSGEQLNRIEALEYNLGRILLVLHTLYETALRRGVVTAEDLATVYRELDLRDGQADDRLDPSAIPGMVTPPKRLNLHDVLAQLEAKIGVTPPLCAPEEFLRMLEQQPERLP